MPKVTKQLSIRELDALKHPGGKNSVTFAVGGVAGLYLKINSSGGRSWILRYRIGVKRREMGLGAYPTVSLKQARSKAHEWRCFIEQGIDPMHERKRRVHAAERARKLDRTFNDTVDEYVDAGRLDDILSDKHRKQWVSELKRLANPVIGDIPVSDLGPEDMLRVLTQTHTNYGTKKRGELWKVSHPSAKKLKHKLGSVMTWATAKHYRSGDNPVGPVLDVLLPKHKHVEVPHPALQIGDVARWMADLRQGNATGHRALEFLALTACRSGEVRGARWDEVNLKSGIWTIPAERMKVNKPHRVPLSAAALALLKSLPKRSGNPLVFFASRGGELSDMTLSKNMEDLHRRSVKQGSKGFVDGQTGKLAVPHGLRATFKNWAVESTKYDNAMSEIALAHHVGNQVERAYRRTDMFEKRRSMMDDWAAFLRGESNSADLRHG